MGREAAPLEVSTPAGPVGRARVGRRGGGLERRVAREARRAGAKCHLQVRHM